MRPGYPDAQGSTSPLHGLLPALASEYPLEIHAWGTKVAVLMCTPTDLEALAWGYLATHGLLSAPFPGGCPGLLATAPPDSGLSSASLLAPGRRDLGQSGPESGSSGPVAAGPRAPRIRVCESGLRVDVDDPAVNLEAGLDLGAVVASGCGAGGSVSVETAGRVLFRPAIPLGLRVGESTLGMLAREMFARAQGHRTTGGMHCAALAWPSGGGIDVWELDVKEDVGRHNAVDKVIGAALLRGMDPTGAIVLTSGRIAADMAMKALACRIPVLASRSIPTTTAYELAVRGGVTLVGRMTSGTPVVYSHRERIA